MGTRTKHKYILAEQLIQLLFGGVEGKVADVEGPRLLQELLALFRRQL